MPALLHAILKGKYVHKLEVKYINEVISFSFIAAFNRREAWTVNEQIKFIQDFLNVNQSNHPFHANNRFFFSLHMCV